MTSTINDSVDSQDYIKNTESTNQRDIHPQQVNESSNFLKIPLLDDIIFDPANGVLISGSGPSSLVFNTLVNYNTRIKIYEPQLAIDWFVTEDSREWTFLIRDNVLFHNGKVLTSTAVELSLERLFNPDHPAFLPGNDFYEFDTAFRDAYDRTQALSNNLVTIYFLESFAEVLETLNIIYILSPDSLQNDVFNDPIGTGPFSYNEQGSNDSYFQFLPFQDHYRGITVFEEIVYTFARDYEEDIANNRDQFNFVPFGDFFVRNYLDNVTSGGYWEVISDDVVIANLLSWINYNNPLLADKQVRLALNLAINQSEYIDDVGPELGFPMKSIYTSDMLYYDDALHEIDYNIDQANQILDDAGYSRNGEGIRFSLNVIGLDHREPQIEILKVQLGFLGIDTSNSYVDYDWFELILARDFDIFLAGFGYDSLDPGTLGDLLRSDGSFNLGGIKNDVFDFLFTRLQKTPVRQERRFYSNLIQQELIDEIPFINLMEMKGTSLIEKSLAGRISYIQFKFIFHYSKPINLQHSLNLYAHTSNEVAEGSTFVVTNEPIYYWHQDAIVNLTIGSELIVTISKTRDSDPTNAEQDQVVASWNISTNDPSQTYGLKLYYDEDELPNSFDGNFKAKSTIDQSGSSELLVIKNQDLELHFIEIEVKGDNFIELENDISVVSTGTFPPNTTPNFVEPPRGDSVKLNILLFFTLSLAATGIIMIRPHKTTRKRLFLHLREDWITYQLFLPEKRKILTVVIITIIIAIGSFWFLRDFTMLRDL